MRIYALLLSALLAGTGFMAQAQDVGQHPAVFAPRQLPGVDPSTFIVRHPASPSWRAERLNHDHPAVVVKREWARRAVDPNTFLVQPPSHTRWFGSGPEGRVVTTPAVEVLKS
jgi:hypothetical protein